MQCNWIAAGAAWCGLAVGLGAFGAHGLEKVSPGPEALEWWSTAAEYHFGHGLALVLFGLWQIAANAAKDGGETKGPAWGWLFLIGSTIFSGTLYTMALGAPRWLGAVTPIGGSALIAAWAGFAWSAHRASYSS